MTTPEHGSEQTFASVSELLFSVANREKELEVEAKKKLYLKRDADGYKRTIRERAQLIADLPATLAAFREKGGIVPIEAEYFAESYSVLANQMLAEDNTFGMGVLLSLKGSLDDEPDELERLAAKLQT